MVNWNVRTRVIIYNRENSITSLVILELGIVMDESGKTIVFLVPHYNTNCKMLGIAVWHGRVLHMLVFYSYGIFCTALPTIHFSRYLFILILWKRFLLEFFGIKLIWQGCYMCCFKLHSLVLAPNWCCLHLYLADCCATVVTPLCCNIFCTSFQRAATFKTIIFQSQMIICFFSFLFLTFHIAVKFWIKKMAQIKTLLNLA